MKKSPHMIIKAPILTEESTIQTESHNKYAFRVAARANKNEIREAVEAMFPVKVVAVNTMNYQGKERRRGRITGRRPHWKKAVVTLRKGDAIDLI